MISEKQREAARANGALSRGPKTPEGKSRSSKNATTHGLLSDVVVLPGESMEGFEESTETYFTRFSPVDRFEHSMIEEMIASNWRLRRVWAIERSMMAGALDRQPDSDDPLSPLAGAFCELADSGRLPLLHRYEARLHQMYQRAVRTLILTRSAVPRQPEGPEPAAEPASPAPDPAPDGPAPEPESLAPEPMPAPSPQPAFVAVPPAPQPVASPAHNPALPNEPKSPPLSTTPGPISAPTPTPQPAPPNAPRSLNPPQAPPATANYQTNPGTPRFLSTPSPSPSITLRSTPSLPTGKPRPSRCQVQVRRPARKDQRSKQVPRRPERPNPFGCAGGIGGGRVVQIAFPVIGRGPVLRRG